MSTKKTARKITTRTSRKPAHVHGNIITLPGEAEYTGPVAKYPGPDWNPEAHGGHCITEVCECHAVRYVNRRGDEIEPGEWHVDVDCASYHLQVQAAQDVKSAAERLASAVSSHADTNAERAALTHALADLDAAVMIAARPQATAAA